MSKKLLIIFFIPLLFACGETEKETNEVTEETPQTFEDFKESYFNGRQCEDLEDACTQWYEECIAAGHSEEDCSTRLEYCGEDGWNPEDCDDEREEESNSDCDDVSQRAYEECIELGNISEEDCRERAAAAYDDCMERE